jgi:uncharacterized membrane protein
MEVNPVLIGLALILIGLLLVFLGAAGNSNAEAGGVVFIGPIPIPFGSRRLWLPALIVGLVALGTLYLARFA